VEIVRLLPKVYNNILNRADGLINVIIIAFECKIISGIELNETPEKALLREVKEETGLNVEIVRLLPKVYNNVWKRVSGFINVIIIAFECKIVSGVLKPGDVEVGELKFFKPEKIDYTQCLPKTKEIINLLNS
jgi:NADH pyrophosphatase NudC (nudix superfamily)